MSTFIMILRARFYGTLIGTMLPTASVPGYTSFLSFSLFGLTTFCFLPFFASFFGTGFPAFFAFFFLAFFFFFAFFFCCLAFFFASLFFFFFFVLACFLALACFSALDGPLLFFAH